MARNPPSIAATSTLAMVRAAEARGVRTADVLRKAGVTRELLETPDTRLPAPAVMAVWEVLRERTGDPTLQLFAPASLPFGAYRVIDYLVAASATVGEGVRRFARYFGIISETVSLNIEDRNGEHRLWLSAAGSREVPAVYVDYVFSALVTRIRMRIRPELRVRSVELRRVRPEDPGPYERVFGAPVHFGAAADCLCFCDEEWRAPTAMADEALARLLEDHARMIAPQRESPGFRADVRKALTAALPDGGSAVAVARDLHMSVRTLQRKLVSEGTTFREVLETAQSQLAQAYLANPKVSIGEVATLLGFSDSSSFNRAFRRWTGHTPGRWRHSARGDAAS
jgi:AraC-like DNA-binding protein